MFKKILFTGLVAIGLSGGSAIGQSFSELSSPNKPLSDSIEGKSELAYDFQQSFDNIESMKTYLLLIYFWLNFYHQKYPLFIFSFQH